MHFELYLGIIAIAFVLEFFDAYAGMGYGTLTSILILMGFPAIEVISAVILTSAVLSLIAGSMHHGFKNINFFSKRNKKILSILIISGIIAIIIGAFVAINIPENILKIYIGLLIISIGILIFVSNKKKKFSKKRLIFFASLASFNKGISGGGYGPVLAGGQVSSGIKSKHAVGITALSEGIISTFGFSMYILINGLNYINWGLVLSLLIGGLISTPLAAFGVKKTKSNKLRYFVAGASMILGIIIILKIFL
jgi:uncharacterized membrane protein YfcA